MFEIRFHGRGGQGAVTAAEITALAAFLEGKCPQCFPAFGLERRGAPVAAFLRIDDRKITVRQAIYVPDFIAVMDATLLSAAPTLAGLKPAGGVLINTQELPDSLRLPAGVTVGTVAAGDIALKHGLGTRLLPLINTTILGALVRMTGIVSLESLLSAIGQSMGPARAEANKAGAREAYETVAIHGLS
jgi:2-oxoacid:acceptor oxidoreductase gamma subunit (pyruvate/2-ketoisovalerate family)